MCRVRVKKFVPRRERKRGGGLASLLGNFGDVRLPTSCGVFTEILQLPCFSHPSLGTSSVDTVLQTETEPHCEAVSGIWDNRCSPRPTRSGSG